jgi:CheY-like chemotaxis protein
MPSYKRLLLIDDDEDDRGFFLEALEAINPDIFCVTAENGQDGLTKLLSENPPPDVIFLDLNMPLMNGRQFLVEIKNHQQLPDIPVVILSTSSDNETKRQTSKLGAKHFITKPDKLSAWESMLKEFFDDSRL